MRRKNDMAKPDSYTKIYIQIVFAVQFRKALIHPHWEDRLYQYICGHLRKKGHKPLAANGMPDHIHILIGYEPFETLPQLVRKLKIASTNFIRKNRLTEVPFKWQNGYGAFSYHRSFLDRIIPYIQNQKKHHRKRTFREEYMAFLEKFEVPYNENYLFDFFE